MPRIDNYHQKLGSGKEGFSPTDFRGNGLVNTLILDFQLPECDKINFYCFKPLSLWYFVMAVLGNSKENQQRSVKYLNGFLKFKSIIM